jgi:hypothetical protein
MTEHINKTTLLPKLLAYYKKRSVPISHILEEFISVQNQKEEIKQSRSNNAELEQMEQINAKVSVLAKEGTLLNPSFTNGQAPAIKSWGFWVLTEQALREDIARFYQLKRRSSWLARFKPEIFKELAKSLQGNIVQSIRFNLL